MNPAPFDLAAQLADLRAAHDAALAEARDESPPPGAAVDRLLLDVGEALRQAMVNGLLHPPAELADELASLGDRAASLALLHGALALRTLALHLAAVRAAGEAPERAHRARGAWSELQRLTAWWRVVQVEHGLRAVEASLAGGDVVATPVDDRTARCTRTLRPLGVELDPHGALTLHTRDVDDGTHVVLRDHVSPERPDDPFAATVASRMFQDAVALPELLRGLVRVDEHPFTRRGSAVVLRPSLRAVPRCEVRSQEGDDALPSLVREAGGDRWRSNDPGVVDLRLSREPGTGALVATLDGLTAPLVWTPTLRLNVTRALATSSGAPVEVTWCAVPRDASLVVLHAVDGGEGRRHPSVDAGAVRVSRAWLRRRIEGAPSVSTLARAAALVALDGTPRDVVLDHPTLDACWRAHHAGHTASDEALATLLDALIASLDDPRDRDARGLLDAATAPDAWTAWRVLHLADGRVDDAVRARLARAFPSLDGSAASVCLRARMAPADEARATFDANLDALARAREVPTCAEIVALADTLAWLRDDDVPVTWSTLGVPWLRVHQACADAVARWCARGHGDGDLDALADALRCLALADGRAVFFDP